MENEIQAACWMKWIVVIDNIVEDSLQEVGSWVAFGKELENLPHFESKINFDKYSLTSFAIDVL